MAHDNWACIRIPCFPFSNFQIPHSERKLFTGFASAALMD